MKRLLNVTFLFLIIIFQIEAQDCKVEQNPTTPVLGMEVKASVNHKDNISFYTVEGITDSLIIYFRFNDAWGRTVQIGDSSIIKLENHHHIKLYSLRESISTFKIVPITMGEGKTWYYAFVAWISKNDVKQLSEMPIKNHFPYSKIDEIYYQDRYGYIGLKTRNKRRDSVEFGGKLNAWYRNLRLLAKCALEL
jgi:hypothetical protein